MTLFSILQNWLKKHGFSKEDFVIPPEPHFGDLGLTVAFRLAKENGESPIKLAHALKEKLISDKPRLISELKVSQPGYLNLVFDQRELARLLKRQDFSLKKLFSEKIVLEHTSVNPNKALHIGHLRNAILGDSIARLLRKSDVNLEVQNYIDDTGVQVADVILALEVYKPSLKKKRLDYLTWDLYSLIQKDLQRSEALKKRRDEILKELETRKGQAARKALQITKKIVELQLKTLAKFDIAYDVLIWESSLLEEGIWQKTFEVLKKRGVIKLEKTGPNKGAWILPFGGVKEITEEKIISADKILVKSNGLATYLAKDIAYHLSSAKFAKIADPIHFRLVPHPGFKGRELWSSRDGKELAPVGRAKRVYTVIDLRQHYLQTLLKEALERLGYPELARNTVHLAYEIVSLSPKTAQALGFKGDLEKKTLKMSGREGIGVKAEDLFEAVKRKILKEGASPKEATALANAAIRYQMLKVSPKSPIVFDLEEALKTTGDSGVYLCYSCVRAEAILRRFARIRKKKLLFPQKISELEKKLILKILFWPKILEEATAELNPTKISRFAYELAVAFNQFYEAPNLLIRSEKNKINKRFRIFLVESFLKTQKEALELLGIFPPKKI